MLRVAAELSRDHHEKWDGSGYPRGLRGNEISLVGRITAIADVYDALLSERCYKQPWPEDKVLELLKQERGRHFQPELVDVILKSLPEIRAIYVRFKDPPPGEND